MENELFLQIILLSGWKLFLAKIYLPDTILLWDTQKVAPCMPQKPTQWPCLRNTSSSEIHLVAMLQKSNQWPCLRNPLSGHASETLRNPINGHASETHPVAMPQKLIHWPTHSVAVAFPQKPNLWPCFETHPLAMPLKLTAQCGQQLRQSSVTLKIQR